MRIAILGATSQIAKDLVLSFSAKTDHELVLYARRPELVTSWLSSVNLKERYAVANFSAFNQEEVFETLINFVGVGNPAQAAAMGATIFDVTLKYDDLALNYLRAYPDCRYIFLSSGAAYGSSFEQPVDENTKAVVTINNLQPQDWYAVAKLHAECRHRALAELSIIDLRLFNYFSHTQDISARFLITDILRSIRDHAVLKISPTYIKRDFLHPTDFYQMLSVLLAAQNTNIGLDCYSRAPIDKPELLAAMEKEFGLRYEIDGSHSGINATGIKPYYYSTNTKAADFGYQPIYTSLSGILEQSRRALSHD